MFGLTKREQRWAAEQKAAETLIPLAITAIEARVAMDTNIDRVAALERDLAAAQAERDALFRSKSTLNTRVLAAEAEVQALRVAHEAALAEAVAKERAECAAICNNNNGDPAWKLEQAIRARKDAAHD